MSKLTGNSNVEVLIKNPDQLLFLNCSREDQEQLLTVVYDGEEGQIRFPRKKETESLSVLKIPLSFSPL